MAPSGGSPSGASLGAADSPRMPLLTPASSTLQRPHECQPRRRNVHASDPVGVPPLAPQERSCVGWTVGGRSLSVDRSNGLRLQIEHRSDGFPGKAGPAGFGDLVPKELELPPQPMLPDHPGGRRILVLGATAEPSANLLVDRRVRQATLMTDPCCWTGWWIHGLILRLWSIRFVAMTQTPFSLEGGVAPECATPPEGLDTTTSCVDTWASTTTGDTGTFLGRSDRE